MEKIWPLFLFLICGLTFAFFKLSESPVSVLVIGGGPAGLATAIEAKQTGAKVTVIEKRSAYERTQQLFLRGQALTLLEKWEVESSHLKKVEIGDKRVGFIPISALEEALLKRAQELGVCLIQDDFIELSNERSVILCKRGAVPYDILVAADGSHSQVRQALSIELDLIGQGKAGAALLPSDDVGSGPIDVSPAIQHSASFVQKFQVPGFNFIFLQGPFSATRDDFITLCKASGWDRQAEQIAANEALLLLDADVYLQKARKFSLEDRRALLVGDAAGTGSFFRGSGANHALESAAIAGRFFKTKDFKRFDAEMDQATRAFIEDSSFLFVNASATR